MPSFLDFRNDAQLYVHSLTSKVFEADLLMLMDGLLIPGRGIIHPVIGVSEMAWFIRSIYIETKVLLTQT